MRKDMKGTVKNGRASFFAHFHRKSLTTLVALDCRIVGVINKLGISWERGSALAISLRRKGGRDYAELYSVSKTNRPGN